ncbi:N-acetyl sugar amidotransferase, partial [Candidatus Pelagibacter sp.]|nr:N-acetyl sugar amidotransferase [Candidatus Pelagibacter sp.]
MSNQRPKSVVEFKNDSNQKSGLNIDVNSSVCDACNYNETKKKIDWKKRENELIKLLSKYKKTNGYDCVVPGSGGKDSAYTAHILKYKYGMNPLTVTWAPHLYTDIGWKNFDNWIKVGGLDNILFTPNGKVHSLLTRLAFKNLLHPFQPFIIGQKIIGPLIALKFNIPLIFYGENQAEYGNAVEENSNPNMDTKFFSQKKNSEIILGGEKLSSILKNYDFNLNDFEPYIAPTLKNLNIKKIEQRYLGYYLQWDPQECYYYAAKNTGFRPNTERTEGSYSKYSSIDDKIDPFHYYLTYIKFGLGRASYDAAQEIRNEKITREEGVNLVKKYDSEFPKKYFKEFLEYIEM